MDNQNIIFPFEEEKKKSISWIVANGMPKPHRFFREIWTMFRAIGFRGMFFGVEDSVFLAVLSAVFILGGSVLFMSDSSMMIILFLISPFLYGIVQVMTIWKEWMSGVYEQKMVCRYTLHQVNTLRMLFFGGISVVLCVGGSMGVSMLDRNGTVFLRILGIAFTSLFLFAALDLLVRWYCRTLLGNFIVPGLWVLLGLVMKNASNWTEAFLMELPVLVFWVLAAGSAVVYVKMLHRWYFIKKEGAFSYVVN